ncbi:glycoside hydrolase family 32 protein [Halorubrum kocurii]|uniref:beta-fructofuranosidase n=1 Tax=Halorubrum kocurii JCM 14978 TaxID=1230456 RepID=M0PAA0_9EURY|nr:glycoside hydrolase family 32 protein [Halorubrum kocurii]EMA67057.1 glycosyl hydrolase family 32 [Halorubrum kocurii JCM 14978]
MTESPFRVGVLAAGGLSDEQRAAFEWLDAREGVAAEVVRFDAVAAAAVGAGRATATDPDAGDPLSVEPPTADSPAADPDARESLGGSYPGPGVGDRDDPIRRFDVLWWHRAAPYPDADPLDDAAAAIDGFLADGGGLLLTLAAMASVDRLSVESVPPDRVGDESLAEPTGVLWRSAYADHPALASLEGLRHPLRARGTVPAVRYERVLPERGEVLASTVRGDAELPDQMTAVSWSAGDGAVIGLGAPVLFAEPPAAGDDPATDRLAETRDRLVAGCLRSLAVDDGTPGRPTDAVDMRRLRERVADAGEDGPGGRPKYHLTPPANWLNDPNGLIRWDGRYHVFYQYNPAGPFHNTIHWGHAVSDDLATWRDEPVALSPSPDGPDRDGCWSGCAVDDDGTPTLLYTGGNGRDQLPCLATTDDPGLRTWEKYGGNPVIESPPADLDVLETEHWRAEFRDHNVWREGGRWHHLVGTGLADGGGAALLYTSETLTDWTYEGPLLAGGPDTGAVWECPELLDLGDRRLLHVSDYENVVYFLGTVEDDEFVVESEGLLDHGDFYAPQSLDDGDRSLTWGWLPEARDVDAQWDAGWSGALSLPRVIETGPDGDLRQRPADEVADLRTERLVADETVALAPDERRRLDVSGAAIEIEAAIALDDAEAVELSVFETPDRAEHTPIRYERDGTLSVDRAPSSGDGHAFADAQSMAVPPYDEPLSLRVFLDRSVIELYANGRHCLTSRVYPTREDAVGVSAVAEGGRASISSLSAWAMGEAIPTDDSD